MKIIILIALSMFLCGCITWSGASNYLENLSRESRQRDINFYQNMKIIDLERKHIY